MSLENRVYSYSCIALLMSLTSKNDSIKNDKNKRGPDEHEQATFWGKTFSLNLQLQQCITCITPLVFESHHPISPSYYHIKTAMEKRNWWADCFRTLAQKVMVVGRRGALYPLAEIKLLSQCSDGDTDGGHCPFYEMLNQSPVTSRYFSPTYFPKTPLVNLPGWNEPK